MKEPDWFGRGFDFSFPASYFPYVVERVRGTPARIEELIADCDPAILTTQVGEGWSIQEHAGHLLDLDELHVGRLDDFMAGTDTLRAADLTNRKTYEANHNAASIDDLLREFRAARKEFVERVEDLDEEQVTQTAIHPRVGKPMRLIDLVYFVAEHDDHHLASITYIAKTLGRK
ncbi:MAG: DinB family protein [Chloroflexota bacterium]